MIRLLEDFLRNWPVVAEVSTSALLEVNIVHNIGGI